MTELIEGRFYNIIDNFKVIILLSRMKFHNSLFERNEKD